MTDTQNSRYLVGLDLGTTNSALAYIDSEDAARTIHTFAVPQVVAPGVVEPRETLPSFLYCAASEEFAPGALRLPWSTRDEDIAVGHFARDQGLVSPGRLIASAKSWLCHAGVNRESDLLPWQGADDIVKQSPVDASSRYLAYYRAAWDAAFPGFPLAKQDFVLTLPASFDQVARELTVKAASRAGLPKVWLIEEPQAAFYAWLAKHATDWQNRVSAGQKILVIDVGGGTSDFTLIRVKASANGLVEFHRVAVGEHLILGGDNFDLALAHNLEPRLIAVGNSSRGERLSHRAWNNLLRQCRVIKETLLGENAPEKMAVHVAEGGSKLFSGSRQCEVTRSEIETLLVDGFFPITPLNAVPSVARSGFQEFGLPYAADAGITRYLAQFLTTHRYAGRQVPGEAVTSTDGTFASGDPARPDVVLFNGGVFAAPRLKVRILESLRHWFGGSSNWEPVVLDHERLDLAVAKGAAYYGLVRRGEGVRIKASLARTYYLGIESANGPKAVCVIPAGAEPGDEIPQPDQTYQLLVAQPSEFPLYTSSTRLTDPAGYVLEYRAEELTALPPLRTVLKTRGVDGDGRVEVRLDVQLGARLTEIGTLDLWCREADGSRTWKLLFDVRAAVRTELSGHANGQEQQGIEDDGLISAAQLLIRETFGDGGDGDPDQLMKRLSDTLGQSREDWPPTLLRRLWETLMEHDAGRKQSPRHEARWLNLLGFTLRPGFGVALDDWRVMETWKLVNGKLAFGHASSRVEVAILWRRIAGGLPIGHQAGLATQLMSLTRNSLHAAASRKAQASSFTAPLHEVTEVWRMAAAFENLPLVYKAELGTLFLKVIQISALEPCRQAALWSLARVGAREPVAGAIGQVISPDIVGGWAEAVLKLQEPSKLWQLSLVQMARRTGDRYRDLPDSLRDRIASRLEQLPDTQALIETLRTGKALCASEQASILGDSLPRGLSLAGG